MEAPNSSSSISEASVEDGSVFCKCEDGWACTITKTDPTKSTGIPFSDCAGGCSCDKKDESEGKSSETQVVAEGYAAAGSKAYCKCPEGFSCTISKIGDPTKFFHCGEGCICVIEENNSFKAIATA